MYSSKSSKSTSKVSESRTIWSDSLPRSFPTVASGLPYSGGSEPPYRDLRNMTSSILVVFDSETEFGAPSSPHTPDSKKISSGGQPVRTGWMISSLPLSPELDRSVVSNTGGRSVQIDGRRREMDTRGRASDTRSSRRGHAKVVVDEAKKDLTNYVYEGGITRVMTGGVMLGDNIIMPPGPIAQDPRYLTVPSASSARRQRSASRVAHPPESSDNLRR
ncbi:hypothetical protein C8J56DRAFT_879572 [Mycena floridula]|nr:hypothetical protein C8J56DRAFT_879572 [Mycena floridula]